MISRRCFVPQHDKNDFLCRMKRRSRFDRLNTSRLILMFFLILHIIRSWFAKNNFSETGSYFYWYCTATGFASVLVIELWTMLIFAIVISIKLDRSIIFQAPETCAYLIGC